ncbi:MAG: 16S rRNA (cytosine(1402)-N(4))-methyltransferase RsmH [Candidatus Omnitrophica bacterium]|nr:16S rRNA (cytosine(1402)-N(4))-methyltransferase RsmH [Candidatus Omnitrophota bacterium]
MIETLALNGEVVLQHDPVMVKEVVAFLDPGPGDIVVDATIGCGGHARPILERIRPAGQLIGIDQDDEAIRRARENLREFSDSLFLVNENFADLEKVLGGLGIKNIDGILFDLGLSSPQIDTGERGFSIKYDAPLDMRMDRRARITAFDLVNSLPLEELSRVLKVYGEERFYARIAKAIVERRKKGPIQMTGELADTVLRAQPGHKFYKIHPATRTFQAFRIAVNNELDSFDTGLKSGVGFLSPGSRICVLSYHSLEDRIAKHVLRGFEREGVLRRLIKKPLRPSQDELARNPRSRSAKLRVAEKNADI